jgi:hypothetical protein
LKAETGDEESRLAQLVEDISDLLFFTVITVNDELNAYKVFETLNSRGVRLSATDLIKNYLFSVLDRGAEKEHELRILKERWDAILGRLQSEKFPDFLRVHWNSRREFARQADLFKTIRAYVNSAQLAIQMLREMEEDLDTFVALSSPEPSDWSTEDKKHVASLRTFRVRQPFPLLLAARRKFDASSFTGLLRAIVVISMRFNVVCSYGAAEQERRYNEVAERISKGELQNLPEVIQELRSVYPEDRAFHKAFAEKIIRTSDSRNDKIVRFILCAIERHTSGQDFNFDSDAFNVEHILPKNGSEGWGGFSNGDAEKQWSLG